MTSTHKEAPFELVVSRERQSTDLLESPLRGGGHTVRSPVGEGDRLTVEESIESSRQVRLSPRERQVEPETTADEIKRKLTLDPVADTAERGGLHARLGVTSEQGARPENQDGWILSDVFAGNAGVSFAAVLDGHGDDGRKVAHFVQETLPAHLAAQADLLTDPQGALLRAFSATQHDLISGEHGFKTECSGATATCALIVGRMLYVANLGDSRTVLGYRPTSEGGADDGDSAPSNQPPTDDADAAIARLCARALSADHKPDAQSERTRIEASGGRVCPFALRGKQCGPARVWKLDEWSPGLAVSRSFGDTQAAEVGVTSEPEVSTVPIDAHCELLVLASDGVWDVMSNEEAVRVVARAARGRSPEEASAELVSAALAGLASVRRKDNVTALVVLFSGMT
mmetsp:Transcript_6885/g.17609  ORF Transcript_6885/g.17609 Transcript_6885/m.17609 type:complete len:400 (+) Transcript_6885:68-1267(+)